MTKFDMRDPPAVQLPTETRDARTLKPGDLVDLFDDAIAREAVNTGTFTPWVERQMRDFFAEVLTVTPAFECVEILFDIGPIRFPDGHCLKVYHEPV